MQDFPQLACAAIDSQESQLPGPGFSPVAERLVLSDLLPAGGLLVFGLVALAIASFATAGRPGGYLVIGPPWFSFAQTANTVRMADGALTGAGGFSNMALAASALPDFTARARYAGAWLVIPSPGSLGCVGSRAGSPDK